MIARIDGMGLSPLQVAGVFATKCFDDDRTIDINKFAGQWFLHGYRGTVSLEDGIEQYGQWWFKRRGRIWAFHRHNRPLFNCGKRVASLGHAYEPHGYEPHQVLSYADGYLNGLPRSMKPDARRRLEIQLYAEIESILYE